MALGCLLAAWLTGCASSRQELVPPASVASDDAPAPWSDGPHQSAATPPRVAGLALPGPWWESLQSPALSALIAQAQAASPTLATAEAALRQAEALQNAQAATTAQPQLDATVGAQRQHTSPAALGQSGEGRSFSLYSAGLQVRYLFDLSGASQHTLQALAARTEWRRHEQTAARRALAGQIAATAIARARWAAQVEATHTLVQQQQALADIAQARVRLGQATPDEALALQALAAQTRASLPPLRQQLQQAEHVLAVLAGQPPGIQPLHAFALGDFTLPTQLPLRVPSQLVRQRPDIQASEALLHAAHAEHGATVARRYPQLQLSANLGSQALTSGALFGAGAAVWALGGQLVQPLFNPAQQGQEAAALAALQAASAQYQGVVLQALRQVADALGALDHGAQALQALREADAAAQASARTVQRRYALGAASYVQLVQAQQQATQATLLRAQAQAQQLADCVALYQALGTP